MIKKIIKMINHPLFTGSFVMVGGSMVINIINYLYHLIMGRLLGPVDYGILASLFSILYIVGIIPSSASVAIVKFIAMGKNKNDISRIYNSINRFIIKFSLIVSFIIILMSPLVSKFLNINNLYLILLISPILFFSIITLVNQATSQGLLNFLGNILPGLGSSVGKLLFGFLLVGLGFSVFGAMVGILLGAVIAYIVSVFSVSKIKNKIVKNSIYSLHPFLRYSFPVLIQALSFTSIFTIDVILVKHYLPPFEAGIYAALSTLGKIIFFASAPISSAMFPIVAKMKTKGQNYRKIFSYSLIATITVCFIIVFTYWLIPDLTIRILYGDAFMSAKPELVLMGFFVLFYSVSNFLLNFLLSISNTKVVILPLVIAIVQPILIYFNHKNITEIILVSMYLTILMFLSLSTYMIYNFKSLKI